MSIFGRIHRRNKRRPEFHPEVRDYATHHRTVEYPVSREEVDYSTPEPLETTEEPIRIDPSAGTCDHQDLTHPVCLMPHGHGGPHLYPYRHDAAEYDRLRDERDEAYRAAKMWRGLYYDLRDGE